MSTELTPPGTLSYFWMQEYDRVVAEREAAKALLEAAVLYVPEDLAEKIGAYLRGDV